MSWDILLTYEPQFTHNTNTNQKTIQTSPRALPGCLSWCPWECRCLAVHQPKPELLHQWWSWIPSSNSATCCWPAACHWRPGIRHAEAGYRRRSFLQWLVQTPLCLTTATGSLLRVAAMLNFFTCVFFSMAFAMSFSVGIGMFWGGGSNG